MKPHLHRLSHPAAGRIVAALLAALSCSCLSTHPWVEEAPPWTNATVAGSPQARLTLHDDSVLVLAHPAIEEDEHGTRLVGLLDGKEAGGAARRELALDEVKRLETNRPSTQRRVLNLLSVALILTGIVVLVIEATKSIAVGPIL